MATCTSPWSLHFRSELFDQARRYHWLTMIHARSRRRNEHLDLRDAVLARDVDLACALIEKHIRTTVEQAASEVPGLTMDGARAGQAEEGMKRRTLIVSAAATLAAPSIARAQAWPANPVRVIHGYDAGSNPDTIARHLSVPLTEILGVQIVIEPKPGAAERLAASRSRA